MNPRNEWRVAGRLLALAFPVVATGLFAQQHEQPPAAGTPRDFRLAPRQTVTLPNGLKLSMVRYGAIPKVAVSIQVQSGAIDEGPQEVQLSVLTADLLLEGTASRSGPEISSQAADLGSTLSTAAGTDAITIGGEALSEYAERFMALAADVVLHPRFAEADVARIKGNEVRNNAIALAEAGEQARQEFRKLVFGDHPYARIYATAASLQGYTTAQVRGFYAKNFGARRTHIYVSGVFDPEAVERAVRAAFSTWGSGSAPTANPPTPTAKRQVQLLDRPGAVQSTVWVGLPVVDPTNPDWIRLNVTDALLGGAFGSRITRNIREDKGYTYSPFSFIWARPKTALWIEQADVTTAVTGASLKVIFSEIGRVRREAPPPAELTGIKNNLIGIFVIRNSSRRGVLGQLQFVDQHGLGDSYLANYVRGVLAVNPEDVRQTSDRYLDPGKMSIAIVGDRKTVDQQVEPYRPRNP
jgi:predicted Zn-dependent peptidase